MSYVATQPLQTASSHPQTPAAFDGLLAAPVPYGLPHLRHPWRSAAPFVITVVGYALRTCWQKVRNAYPTNFVIKAPKISIFFVVMRVLGGFGLFLAWQSPCYFYDLVLTPLPGQWPGFLRVPLHD